MPTWMGRALCSSFPSLPWVVEPQDRSAATERTMGAVCVSCPVSRQCAAYVESREISSGFWAGVDRTPSAELEDGVA